MAGLSDWHRKQRKKETAKNKETRISARNAKALERSAPEIKTEIRQIEKRHPYSVPHAVQNKLDRLKKELKLVLEEEKQQKLVNQTTAKRSFVEKKHFQQLDDPRVSVYYDATMNPYGAPPPGKPRLFHRRGGGVTPYIEDAIVPGVPPTKTLPSMGNSRLPTKPSLSQEEPSETSKRKESRATRDFETRKETYRRETKSRAAARQPKPSESTKIRQDKTTVGQIPDLPSASNAVERLQRRTGRTMNDIWASTDEVEYEENVGGCSLEGIDKVWYYRDQQDVVQGPYGDVQMKEWVKGGFFPSSTLISPNKESWTMLGRSKAFRAKTTVRAQNDPVQDRIAALKAGAARKIGDNTSSSEANVQSRIDTLKVDYNKAYSEGDDSVEQRIAALKAGSATFHKHVDEESITEKANSGANPRARSRDLGGDTVVLPLPPPPPPPPPGSQQGVELAEYSLLDATLAVAPYPIDNSMADIAYPVDDDSVTQPLDDGSYAVGSYPMAAGGQSNDTFAQNGNSSPPIKRAKLSKDIVALMPTNLLKK